MSDSREALPQVRAARADWFVLMLLGVSLAGNIGFAVAFLRMASSGSAPTAAQAASRGPQIDTVLPPLEAERLGGAREKIDFSADPRPTLLYVFTPSCRWCSRNLDNLKTVLTAARDTHRVIAVSLDPSSAEYGREVGLELPIYINPSPETVESYGFGPTPQTLVISREGRVVKSWVGAYAGSAKPEVEEYFRTRLPGLSKPGLPLP